MDKKAAADFLGVSIRTLERYIKDKKLSVVHIGNRPTFSEDELNKLKTEKTEPVYRPAIAKKELLEIIVDEREPLKHISNYYEISTIQAKKLLTLRESAKVSGLSVNYLKWHIKYGSLKGRKIGRSWLIHPQHLDEFIDQLYSTLSPSDS